MTKYTPQQQAIIDSRNKNLIVSASAGTGKTTVMVGRIVEKILKGELDLDNLLAVTFTKLATEDMKNKILSKLQSARQGKANKKEVQRAMEQSEKVDSCAVSTIHSFCADVVRNYFYLVDVDPNFSILEEANAMQLKVQALSITKEEFNDVFLCFLRAYVHLQGRKLIGKAFKPNLCFVYIRNKSRVGFLTKRARG